MKLKMDYALGSAIIILFLFSVENSHAIPAFSRANKVECSTCHTIFPELNEYGEAFLKNAYVYSGKDKKQTTEKNATDPVAAVDDVKPEGIVLSGIPEMIPISFTANLNGTYIRNAVNEFDFSTRALKLNAGGNFREKAGFFGTYLVYTENTDAITNTGQTPTNLTGKDDIGELFVIWRHALESPLNVKVGRFQPKLGLWKSNNKLSITNPYATYSYTVGVSPFTLEQPQDAVEANMIFVNRIFMAGGVVNRKNQNTKEWYVHASVKLGGADYLANEPEIDLNKEESILDYLALTVGGYGYVGTNGDSNTVAGVTPRQNDYYRTGVDIELLYKLFRLKLSGIIGNDDNPLLSNLAPPVKTYAGVIEGEYIILKNLMGSLRFEYVDDGVNVYRRFIPIIAYTPIENLKVALEYKHEYGIAFKSAGNTEIANQIGTLGVTFGF